MGVSKETFLFVTFIIDVHISLQATHFNWLAQVQIHTWQGSPLKGKDIVKWSEWVERISQISLLNYTREHHALTTQMHRTLTLDFNTLPFVYIIWRHLLNDTV